LKVYGVVFKENMILVTFSLGLSQVLMKLPRWQAG